MNAVRSARVVGVFLLVITASAGAAWALLQGTDAYFRIPGVDSVGNPSLDLAASCPGKLFKESRTGVLFGVFTGDVPNQSGATAVFHDQGLCFQDPFTEEIVGSTANGEYVGRPRFDGFSRTTLVVVYNPEDSEPY